MKGFYLLLLLSLFGFTTFSKLSAQDAAWQKEREAANAAATKAISSLKAIFGRLSEEDFSDTPIEDDLLVGKILVPKGTPRIESLRRQIQYHFALIDLAQDYPATELKGQTTLDEFLKGKEYFGVAVTRDLDKFEEKHALMTRLFDDKELQLGLRVFGLMRTGREDEKAALTKWDQYLKHLSGPFYLGSSFEKQPSTLGRSVMALTFVYGMVNDPKFVEVLEENPQLAVRFNKTLNGTLKEASKDFTKTRYRDGRMLRDWCLPVATAITTLYPEETRESIGVTTLEEYKKISLVHARSVSELIELIDDEKTLPSQIERALSGINQYRSKPYYIGSTEIRESGTLKVPANDEVKLLLERANFFGSDGHNNTKTYQARSKKLDTLFTGDTNHKNIEGIISLKSPTEWISFFHARLFADRDSVFGQVSKTHRFSPEHMKHLFLARIILPSSQFGDKVEADPKVAEDYHKLLVKLSETVNRTSSEEFRNFPKEWTYVENGYMEIAKGFPNYSFDRLNVTTSNDLKSVRSGFEKSLYGNQSVANELLALFSDSSLHMESSVELMASPDYRKRIGNFDKKLTAPFVEKINTKLEKVLQYRSYGLASIDSLERPDLQAGRIMTHFAIADYRVTNDQKTNTVMHDFICGPEGGFGGLGQLFGSNSHTYRQRESALDAIASSKELKLGDALFKIAIDIKRDDFSTPEDEARGAARWIQYFRKSQANAQFHSAPEVIRQAIRGTFLSRLVFQSESFQKALKASKNAKVGSTLDISYAFDEATTAQVRKMQGMLSIIDPETASNRYIDETGKKWQDLKVWYVESCKWLEAILSEPIIESELVRVRNLTREDLDHVDLAPEVVVFQKNLQHYGGEVYTDNHPPFIRMARFGIKQVVDLEPDLNTPIEKRPEASPVELEQIKYREFGKTISQQFLREIRAVVAESGFKKLSEAKTPGSINTAYEKSLQQEFINFQEHPGLNTNRAKALEDGFKAAAAKAISRIEGERPSDFRLLYEQMIRASKIDSFLTRQQLPHERLSASSSLVLRDWVDRELIEIMANYRTSEITAEARQMANLAKDERRSIEKVRDQLEDSKAESQQKLRLLQTWVDESKSGEAVGDMVQNYFDLRTEITKLRRENSDLKDSEAVMRAQAARYAQQIYLAKKGEEEETLADAQTPEPPVTTPPPPQPTYTPSQPARSTTPSRSYQNQNSNRSRPQSSPSTNRNFFQRVFGRGNRR